MVSVAQARALRGTSLDFTGTMQARCSSLYPEQPVSARSFDSQRLAIGRQDVNFRRNNHLQKCPGWQLRLFEARTSGAPPYAGHP